MTRYGVSMVRRFRLIVVFMVSLVGISVPVASAHEPQNQTIDVQILAVNDFHGQVTIGRTVSGQPVGGAAYLASYIERERAENPKNTRVVHVGDTVGAS